MLRYVYNAYKTWLKSISAVERLLAWNATADRAWLPLNALACDSHEYQANKEVQCPGFPNVWQHQVNQVDARVPKILHSIVNDLWTNSDGYCNQKVQNPDPRLCWMTSSVSVRQILGTRSPHIVQMNGFRTPGRGGGVTAHWPHRYLQIMLQRRIARWRHGSHWDIHRHWQILKCHWLSYILLAWAVAANLIPAKSAGRTANRNTMKYNNHVILGLQYTSLRLMDTQSRLVAKLLFLPFPTIAGLMSRHVSFKILTPLGFWRRMPSRLSRQSHKT